MLFNSYIFVLLFLPLALAGYFLLNRLNHQVGKAWLLGMSLWFYAYFNFSYFYIIVASIVLNYLMNRLITRMQSRQGRIALLILTLCINLGVLFYYKYYDFFVGNINAVFGTGFVLRRLVIPLGISFFTFQQLSYIIDSYRGEVPAYNMLDYALFVTFFPQLIAGPIVTHDEIVPQFADPSKKRLNAENFTKGLTAFAFGLGKKVLMADIIGQAADWGFASVGMLNTTEALLVVLCYTLQIYFDFSGYCDMATGIGLMFNIDLPMNFESPYRSFSIQEFWKRWHRTLTRFFTRYLYIPLGGNRKGEARTYINIFVVFLVSGLWHGASWTFVLWGAMHGAASLLNRRFEKQYNRLHAGLRWLLTFGFINFAWIYFRAESIGAANLMVVKLLRLDFGAVNPAMLSVFRLPGIELANRLLSTFAGVDLLGKVPALPMMLCLAFGIFAILAMKNTNERVLAYKPSTGIALVTAVLLVWCLFSFSDVSIFLYFNF
ncbi:MBOAT family protein [Ruminococcaceae bacterium OttesenSCG-928-D13]|nr:MBOAT family protein [Ruminococcaceae bacterium OttesenSCG-928-D13]